MIKELGSWLMSAAIAAFGGTLIEFLTPVFKNGAEKYVRFTVAAGVLAVLITPFFGILSEFENNLAKNGIIYEENNIHVTENNEAEKWILRGTLVNLEKGIKKLVYEKFSLEVSVDISAEVTENGIEINSLFLSGPPGTTEGKMLEVRSFVSDYLGIRVYGKAGEG